MTAVFLEQPRFLKLPRPISRLDLLQDGVRAVERGFEAAGGGGRGGFARAGGERGGFAGGDGFLHGGDRRVSRED